MKTAFGHNSVFLGNWCGTINIETVLRMLMPWCSSTRASAATMLTNSWLYLQAFIVNEIKVVLSVPKFQCLIHGHKIILPSHGEFFTDD